LLIVALLGALGALVSGMPDGPAEWGVDRLLALKFMFLIYAAAFQTHLEIVLLLLLIRAALSQMDVPTRSALIMAVVTPAERAAASSFTVVTRNMASAISPSLGGAMLAAGWLAAPLITSGLLKIAYDVALLRTFGHLEIEDA
jgi:predicted MFS family arabinose efflux permease